MRHVAVLDIGKTNAKLALVDLDARAEAAVTTTPNRVLPGPPYPHFDTAAVWAFLMDGLRALSRQVRIDALTVTTHGASAALVAADGALALPVLDYEHDGPDSLAPAYDAVRGSFDETGSPRLPLGLNLGAQLFWQAHAFPDAFARAVAILPQAQYWTGRLTGRCVSEVTSLAAHTDLWAPWSARFSGMVDRLAWRSLFPPPVPASSCLGPVLPDIAAASGLDPATPVHCGIHDSNASLLPHVLGRRAPFAVVSTGTWVIPMSVGGHPVTLRPDRDTLINVNALGQPVPSGRFMGGREFAMIAGDRPADPDTAALDSVLADSAMIPAPVTAGNGPFSGPAADWQAAVGGRTAPERTVMASLYLAIVTATQLRDLGADGDIIVEGPFARNSLYLDGLSALTGRPVLTGGASATGTTIGAAMLCGGPQTAPATTTFTPRWPDRHDAIRAHAAAWHARFGH
jgi:sugar (pentulose or hexulose) kinase